MCRGAALGNRSHLVCLSLWAGILIAALLFLGLSGSCQAKAYPAKASSKFAVGFLNAATCWVEVPLRIYGKYRETQNHWHGACLAPTLGVLEGNTLTLGRLAAGIADVTTFMVPWPYGDFEPIMEPVWKREPSEVSLP